MPSPAPQKYDRVELYIDNIAYLPDGDIRNFSISASYNDSVNQGFSPDGLATGTTTGNKTISNVNWTEYLQPLSTYLNLRTFFLANPNAIITVVPVTIATGVPNAPQFTISGIAMRSIDVSASEEGSPMIRNVTLMAVDSSNT